MNLSDFPTDYKLKMIRAYPTIARMDADEEYFAMPEDRDEAFSRILASRNLRVTHEMFLAELACAPKSYRQTANLDLGDDCDGDLANYDGGFKEPTCRICEGPIRRDSRGSRGWRWIHTARSPWPWHQAEPDR